MKKKHFSNVTMKVEMESVLTGVERSSFEDSWFMGTQPSGPEMQVSHTREGKVERQLHPDIAKRSE